MEAPKTKPQVGLITTKNFREHHRDDYEDFLK